MLPLIGSIIGAGASLIGGMMNNNAQREANNLNVAAAEAAGEKNLAAQKEFAQSGIRWRVEDAKQAGIHPIYALGAQTPTFSPSFQAGQVAPLTGAGDAIASGGQDIGRAVSATLSQPERAYNSAIQALSLERGALENELLRSQINRTRVGTIASGTPLTGPVAGSALTFHGNPWDTNPETSDAQLIQDRYGDLIETLYGVGVLGSDVLYNAPSKSGASTPGRNLFDGYNQWAAKTRVGNHLRTGDRHAPSQSFYQGIY